MKMERLDLAEQAGPPQTMSPSEEVVFVAGLFAALGNGNRLRITLLLTQGERTVNEVSQALGISQPSASLNLATLHRAGIVAVIARGTQRVYSIRGPRIEQILRLAREFYDIHIENIRREPSIDPIEAVSDEKTELPGDIL